MLILDYFGTLCKGLKKRKLIYQTVKSFNIKELAIDPWTVKHQVEGDLI